MPPLAKAPAQVAGRPEPDQRTFASADDAVKSLLDAVKARNRDEIKRIFGAPAMGELISSDPIEGEKDFQHFIGHATEQLRLEKQSERKARLIIGQKEWPFPIPVVQAPAGQWFFDTEAGKREILARRIGHDELATIKVCRAYVQAQREYASKDRDGSGVLQYAQHYWSTPGQKDGLYWEAAAGEEPRPLGPLIAGAALQECLSRKTKLEPRPFHGYYFRILTQQGPAAPGGRYAYIVNGHMLAGFALVAWPAEYDSSGIMTFIINHTGKLYEQDLGPDTGQRAQAMTEYNPDHAWTLVRE